MVDRTEIIEQISMLTSEHKKAYPGRDGLEFHDRPALLEQLREAVFGGMESTGGSSSSKTKLPVSEAAADLYQLIDRQITEAWAAVHERVPSMATPERLVTQWAAAVDVDAIVIVTHPEQLERWDDARRAMMPYVFRAREEHHPLPLAERWVHLIEDFFDPERTAGIKAACLHCGEEKITRRKDGQDVTSDALVFRRDKDTGETLDARCLACGVVWPPSQFEFLIKALELDGDPTVDAPTTRHRGIEWSGSEACFLEDHAECRSVHCRCDCHTNQQVQAQEEA